jgi:predicted transcriptional regulator
MSIGIVDDQSFEEELARLSGKRVPSTHARVDVVPSIEPGRKEGDVNVPDSLRQIIGEDSVINGRQSALGIAKMFGISPSSVSAYAKGATSTTTYDTPKTSIISHINKSRHRAIKKASHTLNSALSAISQEKLDYTDAKDLSGIAKDMSVIIKNLEPPQTPANASETNTPQFVIFAPSFKSEQSFDTIVVNE